MAYRFVRIYLTILIVAILPACTADVQPTDNNPLTSRSSLTPARSTFYLDESALAYGVFETKAVSVVVEISNTTPEKFQPWADISVDDGTGITTYKVEAGESTIQHAMSPGLKRVLITAGGQLKYRNEIRGVFVTKVTFDRPAVQIQLPHPRIVIYGDSIAVGGNLQNPSAEAWPVLLREHFSVLVDGYSYRTLYEDAGTASSRSEFVTSISRWNPDYVWLAIGTNDYEFALWSSDEFGRAYAATLDALHASAPQALVFAQTPIARLDESENSLGDDLQDYRQQIFDVCSARSSWCVFVDGTNPSFPQREELDNDGVHLTFSSSVKYMEAVLHILREK